MRTVSPLPLWWHMRLDTCKCIFSTDVLKPAFVKQCLYWLMTDLDHWSFFSIGKMYNLCPLIVLLSPLSLSLLFYLSLSLSAGWEWNMMVRGTAVEMRYRWAASWHRWYKQPSTVFIGPDVACKSLDATFSKTQMHKHSPICCNSVVIVSLSPCYTAFNL